MPEALTSRPRTALGKFVRGSDPLRSHRDFGQIAFVGSAPTAPFYIISAAIRLYRPTLRRTWPRNYFNHSAVDPPPREARRRVP